MSDTRRLFVIVAEGAVLFTLASWTLIFLLWLQRRTIFNSPVSSVAAAVGAALIVLAPDGVAAWWVFQKLLTDHHRSDARRGAIGFAVSAPVVLMVGNLLGELVGGYAEVFLGRRFILPSIFIFVIALMAVLPGASVMWILHPSDGAAAIPDGKTR